MKRRETIKSTLNVMKINITFLNLAYLVLIILMPSCSKSDKEKVKDEMMRISESKINSSIDLFIKTQYLTCNFNASNYWYPESFTLKEIVDDNIESGYIGLSYLLLQVDSIDDNISPEITLSKYKLMNTINKHLSQIENFQDANNNDEGTISSESLELFHSIVSTSESVMQDSQPLYEDIIDAVDNLKRNLFSEYGSIFLDEMRNIEKESMEKYNYPLLTLKERRGNRSFLIAYLYGKIKEKTLGKVDTACLSQACFSMLNDTAISSLVQPLQGFLIQNLQQNSSQLSNLTKTQVDHLQNAIIYDFSNDYRFIDTGSNDSLPLYFGVDGITVYNKGKVPLINLVYSFGTGSSITNRYYYFENDTVKAIQKFVYAKNVFELLQQLDVENVEINGMFQLSNTGIELKASGYKADDGHCCPSYRFLLDFDLLDNIININKIELVSDDY